MLFLDKPPSVECENWCGFLKEKSEISLQAFQVFKWEIRLIVLLKGIYFILRIKFLTLNIHHKQLTFEVLRGWVAFY